MAHGDDAVDLAGPVDLDHHGDDDLDPLAGDGQLDLAVNVRLARPPAWLQARLQAALAGLAAYPRPEAARAAVAARHRRDPAQVLLTNGAAEAFTLLARGLRPRLAACVHPSFTAPEAALRAAGHPVERVLLPAPFELDPDLVPADADLVVLGNPTNPTARLHPAEALERLARPGRTLVVDEAFADAVGGEPATLAARPDVPGLVVVRSLTKTWGLAGLRVGYLLAGPELVALLAAAQPPWPVNSLALEALAACSRPDAVAWAEEQARRTARWRASLAAALDQLPGVTVVPGGQAPFLLLRIREATRVRARLRGLGVAVRRGDTFPGLGPDWLRIAVAAPEHHDRILHAFSQSLRGAPPSPALVARPASLVARPTGRVTLVGAGPGGADLITLRGWRALHAACTVVPGLSSVTSAPTLAGIPVTHRGLTQSFTVLSGHLPPGHPDSTVDWPTLARSGETLVLLMAVGNLERIAAFLLGGGRPPGTPVACIQHAGTPRQRVIHCSLSDLAGAEVPPRIDNPAVVVIGPTVPVVRPDGLEGSGGPG